MDLSGLNRRSLESLIQAGAFDSLGRRGPILNAAVSILSQSQMEARIRQTGQTSLFGGMSDQKEDSLVSFNLSGTDSETYEKVAWEKELLGVAITSNPLQRLLSHVPPGFIASLDQMGTEMEGRQVTVLGQLSSAQQRLTRDQRPFLNASLELLGGELEVIAWPGVFERTQSLWQEGSFLQVEGKVVVRSEDVSIYCSNVREYDATKSARGGNSAAKANRPVAPQKTSPANGAPKPNRPAASARATSGNGASSPANGAPEPARNRTLQLTMEESANQEQDASLLQNTVEAMLEFPGEDRVLLNILSNSKQVRIDMPFTVKFCPELQQRLEELLGTESINVEPAAP